MSTAPQAPSYDAILFLSFGGPEGQDDVIPFLENVTRGRGIPQERLEEVATHYRHLGGRSPLNDLNREIISNLNHALVNSGIDLPIYFGNRNWHPMVEEVVQQMTDDGVKRALVFATSSWAGYSGSEQYSEDLQRARDAVPGAPVLDRLRQFHDHPLFVGVNAQSLRDSVAAAPMGGRTRVIFTAHSIPDSANEAAGAAVGGFLYSNQIKEHAALVAAAAGVDDYDVVWQSRSGPPQIPWLEPDIVDHVEEISAPDAEPRVDTVVVFPIGFLSDHVEVIWDLDTELAEACKEGDITLIRVATPGPSTDFAEMIADLIRERLDEVPTEEIKRIGAAPIYLGTQDEVPIGADM